MKPTNTNPTKPGELISDYARDTLRALPFLLGLLFAARAEARAYADPGTGALLWQMLAAGFVGAMFYVRKFTTWFKRQPPESGSGAGSETGSASERD